MPAGIHPERDSLKTPRNSGVFFYLLYRKITFKIQ